MIAKLSIVCTKQSNGSYFAICPEVKGCYTQGDTYEQSLANLKELVEVTIKEEMDIEELRELSFGSGKIFSEFEVLV